MKSMSKDIRLIPGKNHIHKRVTGQSDVEVSRRIVTADNIMSDALQILQTQIESIRIKSAKGSLSMDEGDMLCTYIKSLSSLQKEQRESDKASGWGKELDNMGDEELFKVFLQTFKARMTNEELLKMFSDALDTLEVTIK